MISESDQLRQLLMPVIVLLALSLVDARRCAPTLAVFSVVCNASVPTVRRLFMNMMIMLYVKYLIQIIVMIS